MNHLAHLFLANDSPESLAGNFSGDFVHGTLVKQPEWLRDGIRLHRAIDAFSESHRAWLASKHRFRERFGHYSAVIVDVVYDHFLARAWNDFASLSLQNFADDAYRRMRSVESRLPDRARFVAERMSSGNWLVDYADVEGIRRALFYTSKRLRHEVRLDEAVEEMTRDRRELESESREFFYAVMRRVRELEPDAKRSHWRKQDPDVVANA